MRAAITLVLRVGIAGVLLVAGVLKFKDPSTFATEIANYQLLPRLAPYLAVTLPVTELLLGVGVLVLPASWRRGAAAAALALFVMFLGAMLSAFARGIDIACGCFGGGGETITALTLLRGGALVAAGIALLILLLLAREGRAPHLDGAAASGRR